jgi:hypothetical protein
LLSLPRGKGPRSPRGPVVVQRFHALNSSSSFGVSLMSLS